jgi:hypothetical protein
MPDRRVIAGQQNGDGDEETSSVQFRHLQVDPWDTSPYFSMAHFLFLFGKLKVGLNVQRSTPAD